MKKFDIKEVLVPTLSLFLICTIVTLLLAITNSVTEPQIEKLQIETANKTKSAVLSVADSFSDEKTAELDGVAYTYYEGYDAEENVIGYVFTTSAKGYGGEIVTMVGVKADGTVSGMDFLSISETAGLGMNADADEFKNQYVGKSGEIGVNKNAPAENEIQALTGATITSKAVTEAVNIALELFEEVGKNG
ncbi:MAG: FMN-binding protein [Clostridia bacterium]|nr:FMN-binding protein [Clostridia bacterium]